MKNNLGHVKGSHDVMNLTMENQWFSRESHERTRINNLKEFTVLVVPSDSRWYVRAVGPGFRCTVRIRMVSTNIGTCDVY